MEQGFRVGDWQVQPDIGTITRGEEQAQLEPKVMEVLVYLARHANDLLPKEKIIRAVWPDTFVTDEVLTNAISELRKAFGDDAKNPTYIRTLPRRGYRLIAPVTGLAGTASEADAANEPAPRPVWRHPFILGIAGVLLTVIVALMIWPPSSEAPAEEPIDSIAILPFRNDTGDPEAGYLCSSIPASLSAKLCELGGLRVIPSSNLSRFQDVVVEAHVAADQLRVRSVLQGWILQTGNDLSIRVELSDGPKNRVLWGERYHRPAGDLIEIEEDIVTKITNGLRLKLNRSDESRLARRVTEDSEAYQDYLKAEFLPWGSTIEEQNAGALRSIQYFERAIQKDPKFAAAYVGLSDVYRGLGFQATSTEAYLKSKDFAQKALEVGPEVPGVHSWMAIVLAMFDRDWKGAQTEFETAKDLGGNPSLNNDYTRWLLWMGRVAEARETADAQFQARDPLDVGQGIIVFYMCREFNRALEQAIEGDWVWFQILAYQALDREQAAFPAALENSMRNGEPETNLQEYREVFRENGLKGFWRVWADKAIDRQDKPYDIAAAYAYAGETELAFKWLNVTYEAPVFMPFVTDARFDSLRDDPRYEQLLRKLNLPEEAIAIHLKAAY